MILTEDKQNEEDKPLPSIPEPSKGELAGLPPSYEEASAQPSTSSAPAQSPRARTNYTQIVSPFRSIESTSTLDLSLPPLPHLNPSRSTPGDFSTHDRTRPNLFLWSEHSMVKASVNVLDSSLSGPSTPKRAFIVVQAGQNATLEIASRSASTKLHVCIQSFYGNVIVRIPRDFTGPIKCRSARLLGNPKGVRFTPRVQENTAELSFEEKEAYAFVGDPTQVHPPPAAQSHISGLDFPLANNTTDAQGHFPHASPASHAWQGDQIEVIANNGRIKICYALMEGEEKETEGELNTLVRHLQESGPVAALVKFAARGVKKGIQNAKKRSETDDGKP